MAEQITIEDMDTFIEALRYSQTLVNTANSGADLAFDFLRSYDYYGSVRMAAALNTEIKAEEMTISGYKNSDFFQYDSAVMGEYFYELGSSVSGIVSIEPPGDINDNSILTKDILSSLSIMKDGNIKANFATYDNNVSFDVSSDDDNTVFPMGICDDLYYKIGDTIPIDSTSWSVKLSLPQGVISKPIDLDTFEMSNVTISGGISSRNITFSSNLESKEEILKNVIREDGRISSNAIIPESALDNTNIFTVSKMKDQKFKYIGDKVELHLEEEYSDSELKSKIDTFMETSGSDTIYGGEDAFITLDQAEMLAEYIFRKVTGIQKSSIQL